MSGNEAVIDIEALEGLVKAIDKLETNFDEGVRSAIKQVEQCGAGWSDEDFERLSLAMTALTHDVANLKHASLPLKTRAKEKLELIKELYSMKI